MDIELSTISVFIAPYQWPYKPGFILHHLFYSPYK
jgi:hypothetical protein